MALNDLNVAAATIKAAARQFAPLIQLAAVCDTIVAAANQHEEVKQLIEKAKAELARVNTAIAEATGKAAADAVKAKAASDEATTTYDNRRRIAADVAERAEKDSRARVAAAEQKAKDAELDAMQRIAQTNRDVETAVTNARTKHSEAMKALKVEHDAATAAVAKVKAELDTIKQRLGSVA